MTPQRGLPLAIKRALDLLAAALGLAVVAPCLTAMALLVRATMGPPALYGQERIGRGGRPFVMLKLRTMAAGSGPDAARLTALGRRLRATSLDELPQLINILRGEMSLVGPRPLLPAYLPRYSPTQARRHAVLPGVTGLAQVRGRNALAWPERLALDAAYADGWSLALDLKILWATAAAVWRRRGIDAADGGAMPPFTGAEGGRP